jgi:cytochrome c-type biogenesis protein CcmH/NrfG
MTAATDWLSAMAMILSGAIVGFMFIYASMRKKQHVAPVSVDLELRDLEARRDTLIQQLRDLEDVPANGTERTRLEREAAQVLRALAKGSRPIEGGPPAGAPSGRDARSPRVAMSPTVKGFLWGVGSVGLLVFLGWFVWRSTTERTPAANPAPMQTPSAAQQQQAPQSDPQIQQLEAAVAKSPNDVNARMALAKAYLEHENMMGVFEQTQAVLQRSPNEPRALTYQALVRMAMGQGELAHKMLEAALKSDPSLLDAWIGIAWIDFQSGKPEEGEKAMQEAMRRHPEEQARLSQILGEMKSRKATAPAAASAPSGLGVHVTLDLDPAARARVAPNAVLFLVARGEGVSAGPPAAVKRLSAASFPMDVELTAADSMMGQPLPPKLRLEARIDKDGVATTKEPTDPIASADGVTLGSTVTLTLR